MKLSLEVGPRRRLREAARHRRELRTLLPFVSELAPADPAPFAASRPSWRSRSAPRAGRSRRRRTPTAEWPRRRSRVVSHLQNSASPSVADVGDVDALEVAAFAGQDLELGPLRAPRGTGRACAGRRRAVAGSGCGSAMYAASPCCTGVFTVNTLNWWTLRNSAMSGCGRRHIADLPAGHVVGLAETGDDEGARGQAREARRALVLLAVEHHVLVDLVADQQHVGGRQQVLQPQHLLARSIRWRWGCAGC